MQTHDSPRLLVEWSSPRQEFLSSIKPALSRSEARLAGEAPFGLVPLRIMIPSYVLEAFVILAAIFVQIKVEELRPYVAPRLPSHEVIYYTGAELPRTEDLGGAEAGTSGRAGGDEAYHRSQTIKIARGGSLVPEVVDAPNLKLPPSHNPVANLLAVRPDAGPPPVEGMRSSRSMQNLAAVVLPAPNVVRDYTRNGAQIDSVIGPAPAVTREQPLIAPNLSAILIAPAPSVANDHQLVAPVLVPAVVPPAPRVTRERTRVAASLNVAVVAPAPKVTGDSSRAAQALTANVIPPAPTANAPEISRTPIPMMDPSVVPPPVSAPERATSRTSKLTMPTPVAPPPSADITADARRRAGRAVPDPSRTVVPPPPAPSGGSFMSSLIGKIFGPAEVVPPPPAVNSRERSGSPSLSSNVVPPPPVSAAQSGRPSRTRGTGAAISSNMAPNVVPPPPSVGVVGGTGNHSRSAAPYAGTPSVVPPPPSVSGIQGGSGNNGGAAGMGGTLSASNVVPPPPAVGGGSATAGSGLGRRGEGLGSPMDAGAALAPPKNGGSGSNTGAVISSQPGSKLGLPTSGSAGSLAMSPAGGDKAGIGGKGGGTGISRGNGPGSGISGAGSGAAKSGAGHGSDANAHGGISPASGPGGAGNTASGTPPVRGVDISGGSSIVTLPGFGSDPAANDPSAPGRSTLKQHQELNVIVVATATSGGAFEPYKSLLHGEQYTTYFDTSLGTVVMEFSEENSTAHSFGGALTAPVAIRTDLVPGLPHARMVVACKLDAYGNLKNVRVLEAGPAAMTAKVVAALRSWKFQPAMKSNQPVEVTAIIGFGINTNDRF
ncbi:MAG: energy transducer TonB [Candidatus Sulfotelmatobacter sp.]